MGKCTKCFKMGEYLTMTDVLSKYKRLMLTIIVYFINAIYNIGMQSNMVTLIKCSFVMGVMPWCTQVVQD